MRVCLAVPYFKPELGAASIRAESLASTLVKSGHEVVVVTPKPSYFLTATSTATPVSAECADFGLRMRRIPLRLRSKSDGFAVRMATEVFASIAAFPALLSEIEKADLVYASSPPVFYAMAAAIAARIRNTPVVVEIRDFWPDIVVQALPPPARGSAWVRALQRGGTLVAKALCRTADRLVAVTRSDSTKLQRWGIDRSTIFFAPNGADKIALSVGANRQSKTRPEKGDPLKIAYAGRLGPAQKVSALLEAARLVDTPLTLSIIGAGPEVSRLRDEAGKLKRHSISILDPLPREQVLEILIDQDAIFVPLASKSIEGSVPSKLFESLALGVPVILAAEGEATNLIKETEGGIVAEPGSPSSIARAIEVVAADRESFYRRGIAARQKIIENYRREEIMSDLIKKLENIVN